MPDENAVVIPKGFEACTWDQATHSKDLTSDLALCMGMAPPITYLFFCSHDLGQQSGVTWLRPIQPTPRQPINIVFDGPPPGPDRSCPRFVEVQTDDGKPIDIGAFQILAWYKRVKEPGQWALRITELPKR